MDEVRRRRSQPNRGLIYVLTVRKSRQRSLEGDKELHYSRQAKILGARGAAAAVNQ